MNKFTVFSVTSTPETALKKLSKAKIEVFNVKKRGTTLLFSVHDNNVKKVFAIFAHPCYNICIRSKSPKNKFLAFVVNRIGIVIGCILFLAAVALSDSFIFKISVTGSGSYLENEVLAVMRSAGVSRGAFFKGLDKPYIQSRIMALPSVTFCTVAKRGSVILVDVQVDGEHTQKADYMPLISDVSGVVRSVTAVCGTAEVSVGQTVQAGTTLIGAYEISEDGASSACLVVGYAEIEVTAHISCAAEEDSEKNAAAALAAIRLYSDKVTARSCTVKTVSEGVVYEVDFTYLHTLKMNIE